jgi:surface antigen
MPKRYIACLLVVLLLGLAACASNMTKAQQGATVGALTGALVGSNVGERSLTTAIVGAGAGLLLGYVVGNEMDKYDKTMVSQTLETRPSSTSSSWVNPDTGKRFSASPGSAYQGDQGRICRPIQIKSWIDGEEKLVEAQACRDPNGRWVLQ